MSAAVPTDGIPMRHVGVGRGAGTGGHCEAVSDEQAAYLETLGWARVEPPEPDEPAEVFADTAEGLGDVLQLATPDGTPLDVVPDGTVDEVLAWVGEPDAPGFAARAAAAIAAEQTAEHPRKTVTTPLEAALASDTPPGEEN